MEIFDDTESRTRHEDLGRGRWLRPGRHGVGGGTARLAAPVTAPPTDGGRAGGPRRGASAGVGAATTGDGRARRGAHTDPTRPGELSFGVGVGYAFPTSLQTPNTTSVRVRLPSGLTCEPQVVFATTSNSADNGPTNRQTELSVGSLVRYPIRAHRKVDLELIGDASISSRTTDPDGNDNNTTVTTIALGYGGALSYWLSPHWSISLTATNPLLAYSRDRQERGPAVDASIQKTTTIGLVFDPQVTAMIHLYD
jgi:hypothetical protein